MSEAPPRDTGAVLFDLDGTLIDTAPDMVRVLADMLDAYAADALPYPLVRSTVSNGSLGLVRLGFPQASEDRLRELQLEYLERYEQEVCRDSALFPDLAEFLARMDRHGRPWGIVTNKPERMTHPLLQALSLTERAACTVSGDTLPQRKPDPAPLLFACEQAGVRPEDSVYVGDALRDIAAGRAAGMFTVAAAYGYITSDDSPDRWQADSIAADTSELTTILEKAVSLPA
jgi:phosphoglycolate phosphatase